MKLVTPYIVKDHWPLGLHCRRAVMTRAGPLLPGGPPSPWLNSIEVILFSPASQMARIRPHPSGLNMEYFGGNGGGNSTGNRRKHCR